MGVISLPKTVTRQHRGCDLNPGPSAPESSTLTTRLPSHHTTAAADKFQLVSASHSSSATAVMAVSSQLGCQHDTACWPHLLLNAGLRRRCCWPPAPAAIDWCPARGGLAANPSHAEAAVVQWDRWMDGQTYDWPLHKPSDPRTTLQPFNGLFSRTTWESRYQKCKTNLDFTGTKDSEWQWHQLGHTVCNSAPRSRQITTPAPHHSVFYRPDALPAAQPTASKHWRPVIPDLTGLQKPISLHLLGIIYLGSILKVARRFANALCTLYRLHDPMSNIIGI